MLRGNKQALHSRYNPQGEAERYINTLALNSGIRFFILIEPGLGYLIPPLRKKNNTARIIALYAEDSGKEIPAANCPDSFWSPGSGLSLQDFLECEIPDTGAGDIKIVEWRPSLGVYGEDYLRLLSETAEFIKRSDANTRTVRQFGPRWFKNFFRNLALLSEALCPVSLKNPLAVTGAGPGLEETIPFIKEEQRRGGLLVLAVSSSALALLSGGVEPDLVIAVDGGGWALLHLYECLRHRKTKNIFAVSLTAAVPSQCGAFPILPLSDGSLWQELILKAFGIPFIPLPQRGTVSASALDLAFCLTEGKIFLTGLDLSHKDMRTHVRPYSFDRLWEEKACRVNPLYSQVYSRSLGISDGGSHGIYASWFGNQLKAYPKRLYSLGSNNPVFGGLETLPVRDHPGKGESTGKEKPVFKTLSIQPRDNPAEQGALILKEALRNPLYTEKLICELGPLLFPPETPLSPEELGKKILSLACPGKEDPNG